MLYCEKCNYLFNFKKTIPGTNEIGHLFCENCGNTRPLENNTLIYQAKHHTSYQQSKNLSFLKEDIYQRKVLSGCPNKECPTNKKGKTEVVIYRDNDFNTFYICTTCNEKIENNF